MKPNCGAASTAFGQAQSIIRMLETECDVWALKTRDIPIWWFVRDRFYAQLLKHFDSGQGETTPTNTGSVFENLSHLLSICPKATIFAVRSLIGMIRLMRVEKSQFPKESIIFLSLSSTFRGAKGEGLSDMYFDPIYEVISSKSILIERTSLNELDFRSLLLRKDAVFFDWLLLRALLKLFPNLWRTPRIKGWRSLQVTCQSIDFGGISSGHLLEMLQSVIDGSSRKVVVQVEASRMLVQAVNPGAIIEICSYDSAPRAMNLVAKRQGIPIVELQHGIGSSLYIVYSYWLPSGYQGEKPVPDRIMVFGEAFKKTILGNGSIFAPENIVVAGFPRLSIFLNKLEREGRDLLRKKTRRRVGLAQDVFVLTVTSITATSSCMNKFLKEALRALPEDEIAICIKPHPGEGNTWKRSYRDLIQDPRVTILKDRDIDLYDLLVASDAHATVCSTVFLESLALGVPTIIFGCPGYQNALEVVDEGEILFVNDEKAFVAKLTKLAGDAAYRQEVVSRGMEAAKRFFAVGSSPVETIIREIDRCQQ